jgi:ABC-type tungstate transport system permease subunit
MIDPKVQKQAKPNIVVAPKSSPAKVALMPGAAPTCDRIRERAYALYESRGREAGLDEQDWLRAEREILNAER